MNACMTLGAVQRPQFATIEQQAESWLLDWAKFTGDGNALGYPRRSVTEKANEGGITAGSPRPPSDLPEAVALTDKALSRIRNRCNSILWRVIDLRYRCRLPLEAIMRQLRMKRNEVKLTIARAHRALFRERSVMDRT